MNKNCKNKKWQTNKHKNGKQMKIKEKCINNNNKQKM